MKSKSYPCVVLAFALAMLGLEPTPALLAQTTASEPDGTHSTLVAANPANDSRTGGADDSDAPTCVMVQRATAGEVADSYIWSATPGVGYDDDYLFTGLIDSGEKRSLIRFGLDVVPPGAEVQSATFGIWENGPGSGETIAIYRIVEPWAEGEPTWDSFATSYDGSIEWGSFVAGGPGFMTADVTALASAWVAGEVSNYGLLPRNTLGQAHDQYASSEAGPTGPWLVVCYFENNDPVAVDDFATTDEGTPVTIDVLANDSDPDGDPLTVSDHDSSTAWRGTVDCATTGPCTYTPPAAFSGTDTFTYTASDGRTGTCTATVTIEVIGAALSRVTFLPRILHDPPHHQPSPAPDLVVAHISATSNDVLVVIRNQGDAPVVSPHAFWVDLYVDPDPVPTGVNQTWDCCADEGMVWGVPRAALPMEPGDEITLAVGDEYYWPTLSNFSGSFPAGTPIYAQVDSANADTSYGAVLENHEIAGGPYNNVGGPAFPAPDAVAQAPAAAEQPATGNRPRALHRWPPRPPSPPRPAPTPAWPSRTPPATAPTLAPRPASPSRSPAGGSIEPRAQFTGAIVNFKNFLTLPFTRLSRFSCIMVGILTVPVRIPWFQAIGRAFPSHLCAGGGPLCVLDDRGRSCARWRNDRSGV